MTKVLLVDRISIKVSSVVANKYVSSHIQTSVQKIVEPLATTVHIQQSQVYRVPHSTYFVTVNATNRTEMRCIKYENYNTTDPATIQSALTITITTSCGSISYSHPKKNIYIMQFLSSSQPSYYARSYYFVKLDTSEQCLFGNSSNYLTVIVVKRSVTISLPREIHFRTETMYPYVIVQKPQAYNCIITLQYRRNMQVLPAVAPIDMCKLHEVQVYNAPQITIAQTTLQNYSILMS